MRHCILPAVSQSLVWDALGLGREAPLINSIFPEKGGGLRKMRNQPSEGRKNKIQICNFCLLLWCDFKATKVATEN